MVIFYCFNVLKKCKRPTISVPERAIIPYSPAVQPSTFLTFVYDNCNHNPETLTGATMHCTDGIIIQRKSGNDQPDEALMEENTNPSVERKSFDPVDTDITPYHQLQGFPPDKIPEIERNTNIIKEYLSKKGDLLWILLRRQKTYNTDNEEQTIPGWTGFYHEVTNASEKPIHDIHYLPAINSSPTKYDTVKEILTQVKANAEALGVTGTDLVLDHAKYAKALQVLQNPNNVDLKKFINHRMGGFDACGTFFGSSR